MIFLYNKHSNMRICWTCEIWNDQSFIYRPTKLNYSRKRRDDTHTCTDVSTALTHSWCELNPNGMWWDSAALIGWRSRKWTHSNSHNTTNDQWETQTLSDWANQNLSSWWEQQGLDKQWWVAKTALSALL